MDEHGKPAGAARVRLLTMPRYSTATTTGPDGMFRLAVPGPGSWRTLSMLLTAESARGLQQGFLLLDKAVDGRDLRITLKPAFTAAIAVADAAGRPVEGARVVLLEESMQPLLTAFTGADGKVLVRYPAAAKIRQVIAFKSGLGFDYFSTLLPKSPPAGRGPLPGSLSLRLSGARTVRVKAVDSANRPVAGIPIAPWYVQQKGKPEDANISGCTAVSVSTDASGTAVFDWLPEQFDRGITFSLSSPEYSYVDPIVVKPGVPAGELTLRLIRKTRISGRVLGPGREPGVGILVEASGAGPAFHNGHEWAWTRPDGSYEMLVNSEEGYIVTVVDDRWAAPSHVGVVVREGKPVRGLDFQLAEGTVVRGTVTLGPDRRTVAKQGLMLSVKPVEIPAEIKKPGDTTYRAMHHTRWATTDARGTFRFCVGPGTYELAAGLVNTQPVTLTVTTQREIVHDFHVRHAERGRLAGKVIDAGGQPVPGAAVQGVYMASVGRTDPEATTADDGTFAVERVLVPTIFYARTKQGAAGIARIDDEQGQVTIRVGPTAEARGRLRNYENEILAGGRVRYGLNVFMGPTASSGIRTCFGGTVTSGPDGRYTLTGLVPGQEYAVTFEQSPERGPWSQLTTVKPARAETVELGDTSLTLPVRPLTPEERTTRFFKPRGKLAERIARAQAEAQTHYLRVLLVVADPKDARARQVNELRTTNAAVVKALLDYEQLPVAADDAGAMAVLRQHYAFDGGWPALVILSEDGKALATLHPTLEAKDSSAAARDLEKFLAAHALLPRDAEKMVAEALARARREGKHVFLQETGTYCSWCRVLSRFLEAQQAILGPNYVFVEIDRTRFTHGEAVMQRYRPRTDPGNVCKGRGIPWCAILDGNGKVLATWDGPDGNIGYPNKPTEIDYFLGVLAQTAPRLSAIQLGELRRALETKR